MNCSVVLTTDALLINSNKTLKSHLGFLQVINMQNNNHLSENKKINQLKIERNVLVWFPKLNFFINIRRSKFLG